jgi:hypothetical protein
MDQFLFKKPKSINQHKRKRIWEMYFGPGVKQTLCPLCGVTEIQNTTQNSGFNLCHIVADKFMFEKDMNNIFYFYPGCGVCNQECADLCILDYLYGRGRFNQLRSMIWAIYSSYLAQYQSELSKDSDVCWKIIQYLYGSERFPAGGGIYNEKQIYELARTVHHEKLIEKTNKLLTELQSTKNQMMLNMTEEIKPKRLKLYSF